MRILVVVIVSGLLGCGGVVEGGSGDPGEASEPPREGPAGESPEPDADSSGIGDPMADTELGSCVPGKKERYDQPCAWVANERCYATREMACNCACPRTRDSQCVSGFGAGPDGHVWVDCN